LLRFFFQAEDGIRDFHVTGVQTCALPISLWQLLSSATGEAVRVPALRIEDAPRFSWRGLMLDSARHFQTVDQIKSLIDAMARHRSEERRVGKECGSRGCACQYHTEGRRRR